MENIKTRIKPYSENSFYKKIDFSEYVQFERWEKTKCDAVKCARIRTRNN